MSLITPVWWVLDAEWREGFRATGSGARVGRRLTQAGKGARLRRRTLPVAIMVIVVATAAALGFGGRGNYVGDTGFVHFFV